MKPEQTLKLRLAHAQPFREALDVRLLEHPRFDQPQSPGDGVGTAAPEREVWCHFRPAAQTGAETGFLRRGGRGKEPRVLPFWRGRRAARPTVNSGCRDGDEQTAIETMVSRLDRAVTGVVVHVHARMIPCAAPSVSRFSDVGVRA